MINQSEQSSYSWSIRYVDRRARELRMCNKQICTSSNMWSLHSRCSFSLTIITTFWDAFRSIWFMTVILRRTRHDRKLASEVANRNLIHFKVDEFFLSALIITLPLSDNFKCWNILLVVSVSDNDFDDFDDYHDDDFNGDNNDGDLDDENNNINSDEDGLDDLMMRLMMIMMVMMVMMTMIWMTVI
ncbi:hypothetical protein D915_006792 [Fasciola hepatica]|uniref:Uncharacterized protein n=1 Tax=Fasciola hepatica TaxID=6192 RepID=A0A4E0RYX2_FASHE|nr:hypothetical protein D915_006792 [Fasciola hepatica]